MAPIHQFAARTLRQFTISNPSRPLPQLSLSTTPSRTYHRLLKEQYAPYLLSLIISRSNPLARSTQHDRLMQGFNTTTSSHFHTSPPHPSPPIDLLIFPHSSSPSSTTTDDLIYRIPLLPTNTSTGHAEASGEMVQKPEIWTVSADSTHVAKPSAMSEETDEEVRMVAEVEERVGIVQEVKDVGKREVGVVRELWRGLLDDVLGEKKVKAV